VKNSLSIRLNRHFKQAMTQHKSKLSKGKRSAKASRFIHKQAQKHRKIGGFYCDSKSYVWSVTHGNCYFRRRGVR